MGDYSNSEARFGRFSKAYALGFSVVPVPAGRKQPTIKWKPFQNERASVDQVRGWDATDQNVAIITGCLSDLAVLDLDSAEAEAEARNRGWVRDDTPCVRTAHGRHVYYRMPPESVGNKAKLAGITGVDFRGEGGFVIGPGSQHRSGHIYGWERHPDDFPLGEPPKALLDAIRLKSAPARPSSTAIRPRPGDNPELAAFEAELTAAEPGQRNDLLNRAAFRLGQLQAAGRVTREEWEDRLRLGAEACGLPTDEIDRTLTQSIAAGQADPRESDAGVCLDDFHAYMPSHNYIFSPSGETWPGSSVNSRIPPVAVFDRNGAPVVDDEGEQVRLPANRWLDQYRPVEQMTWAPGEPQIIADRLVSDGGWISRSGCNTFNLYRPPAPSHGDASKAGPWIDHVKLVYPTDAEHIFDWCAHRVQRPAEKLNHALVFGGAMGIGKDTICEPVKIAVGPWNFVEVTPKHILGRFNSFTKSVIMRVSEARDLGEVDRFAFYDHMKTYTAAPPDVLRVDEKNLREHAVFNVCGVIFTTNHKGDGLFLPEDDRRHYVAWSRLTKEDFDPAYWKRLWDWYGAGGIANVAAFLAERDLSAFDPKAPPPKTEAFWDIVAANAAPEAAELSDALEMLGWPDAVTLTAVALKAEESFALWLKDRRNSRRIPHKMEECGYRPVRNPSTKSGRWKIRTDDAKDGKEVTVYARHTLAPRDAMAAAQRLLEDGEHVSM